jgi:hypothetical protein
MKTLILQMVMPIFSNTGLFNKVFVYVLHFFSFEIKIKVQLIKRQVKVD